MDSVNAKLNSFIEGIPKAELHVHIEGTLEPELYLKFAQKNGIQVENPDPETIRSRYNFTNLQDFLDLYHEATRAIQTEDDFYELTDVYFQKLSKQNVRHVELFVDSQTHTARGIPFETVINGIHHAMEDAKEKYGISSYLILCFLRNLSEDEALRTLDLAVKYKDKILGIGLASSELGHPPSKFKNAFDKARMEGFRIVAHAGEEGPPEYIWQALDMLKVERIDHGNRSLEDSNLIDRIAKDQIPLTMCPLSNHKLCVIDKLEDHPAKKMLSKGIKVTLNSDDPAYFGGQLNDNYIRTALALNMGREDIVQLARNSFTSSFLPSDQIALHLKSIDDFVKGINP
jgi:adenosine deaminase